MKKMCWLLLIMVVLNPLVVKANIVCNDGTISAGCNDCHQGCCSRHGGCTDNPNSGSSSSNSSYTSSTSTNKKTSVPEIVKSDDTSLEKVTVDGDDVVVSNNMQYSTLKDNVIILAVANDSNATVEYRTNVDLVVGQNVIDIKVTAENGNEENYTLIIEKQEEKEDMGDIKEEIVEEQTDSDEESDALATVGTVALLGGAGYLIYKNRNKK